MNNRPPVLAKLQVQCWALGGCAPGRGRAAVAIAMPVRILTATVFDQLPNWFGTLGAQVGQAAAKLDDRRTGVRARGQATSHLPALGSPAP